jgi:homoserine O-acetyltransferase
MVDALIKLDKPVSYCNVKSTCGHDAFLLPDDLPVYGEMVRAFLDERMKDEGGRMKAAGSNLKSEISNLKSQISETSALIPHPSSFPPDSIFHEQRLDYDTIVELIPPGASVLDLGCGQGGLLARLQERGHSRMMGVELDQDEILASLKRGLDVVQGDLNHGLDAFADAQFDVVILSQTLQTVTAVERVLRDMLRVGRQGIVSFPNLAFHKLRSMLADAGRAPRAGAWLGYNWYNTPNVRFLSIADFHDFCHMHGIRILKQIALNTEEHREVSEDVNRNADVAVVVIGR